MKLKMKTLAAAAALAFAGAAQAQISGNVVKIGILNDQSSLYADLGGQGSVTAAKMAIEDFKAKDKGLNVEVIFADHQNKPDVGTQIANKWIDAEGVDVIVDTPNSGVALAVNEVVRTKGIPAALYHDRHGIFLRSKGRHPHRLTIAEQLTGRQAGRSGRG